MKAVFSTLALILIFVVVSSTFCNDKLGPTPNPVFEWKTDFSTMNKYIGFLGTPEKGAWAMGIKEYRGGGWVPAPSSYFLKGYVKLSDQDFDKLRSDYLWEESPGVDPKSFVLPEGQVPFIGPVFESKRLAGRFGTLSCAHAGNLYLIPDQHCIYFDLVID